MTVPEFAAAVVAYRKKYTASVTSWGRTDVRARIVGGFPNDPHTWDLGADFVYDTGPNRPGAVSHNRSPASCAVCSDFGLKIIHEGTHDHAQPLDFPVGPVTEYNGEKRSRDA